MSRRVQRKPTEPVRTVRDFDFRAGREFMTVTGRFVRLTQTMNSETDGLVGEFVIIDKPGGDIAVQPGRRAALPETLCMREATAKRCMTMLG